MKKNILIVLLCFIVSFPTFAYEVKLNGVDYQLVEPLQVNDNTMYLSAVDIANVVFGNYSRQDNLISNSYYRLVLYAHNSRFSLNSIVKTLRYFPFLQQDVLYVPVEVLDYFDIEYYLDDEELLINTPIFYSLIKERFDNNYFTSADYSLDNLPPYLINFLTEEQIDEALELTYSDEYYLSFMDNSIREEVYTVLAEKLKGAPYNRLEVLYKEYSNGKIGNVVQEDIRIEISPELDKLIITIGDDTFEYSNILATFLPSVTDEVIIEKTIDVTIMHSLYTYYRDKFDLRDDIYYTPLYFTSTDSTNIFAHDAYDNEKDSMDYTIDIQRLRHARNIQYIINVRAQDVVEFEQEASVQDILEDMLGDLLETTDEETLKELLESLLSIEQ